MDKTNTDLRVVGKVEFSNTYEVKWRLCEQSSLWAARAGGEYHCVGLPDGSVALIRWVGAEASQGNYVCRSVYLGVLTETPGQLSPVEFPAESGEQILSASSVELEAAFWQDPLEDALQIACLKDTGDLIREWLYLPLRRFNRHLGIFAQSGSGKSYALGKLIEELIMMLSVRWNNTDKRKKNGRSHVIILDPNGDFENFQGIQKDDEVLQNIDRVFQGSLSHIPELSWEEWVSKRVLNWKNMRKLMIETLFPNPDEERVSWHVVDLRNDENGEESAQALRSIKRKLFSKEGPTHTFIVIDEAHNIVPWEIRPGTHQEETQKIVNNIAAEGRKYGAFLVLVSQSPSKIHPNTLTQCANLIVMRTTTQEDIDTISNLRRDLPRALIERVATFKQGEALFIGEFVPAPVTAKIVGRITREGGSDPKLP